MPTPLCLTIAGSDNSGGAGIQADLRTFHAFGCYGLSTITGVTAQTPTAVRAVHAIPSDIVGLQLVASLELQPAVIKTGLLLSPDIINAVSHALKEFSGPVVVDPVMAAGCGGVLNQPGTSQSLQQFIRDHATVITPNIPEAQALVGDRPWNDGQSLATALAKLYDVIVLLKGGHAEIDADRSSDFLVANGQCHVLKAPLLTPIATHGTGCTMASALAAGISQGDDLLDAAIRAKAFVWHSLAASTRLSPTFSAMVPPKEWDASIIEAHRF